MDSIRIFNVPPGVAPEEVRRELVGLTLPVLSSAAGTAVFDDGYRVQAGALTSLLRSKSWEASFWFLGHYSSNNYVAFPPNVCEFLSGVETVVTDIPDDEDPDE